MIEGAVNTFREALVEATVIGPADQDQRVTFVVDTGFDGGITLSASVVTKLGLRPLGAGRAILADGSHTHYEMFEAFVEWDGTLRRTVVDAAETEPLLGMGLLEGHQLRVDVVSGGRVSITRLGDA